MRQTFSWRFFSCPSTLSFNRQIFRNKLSNLSLRADCWVLCAIINSKYILCLALKTPSLAYYMKNDVCSLQTRNTMFRISPFYNESKKEEIKYLQADFTPDLVSRAVRTLICSVRLVGSSFDHSFWQSEKSILRSEE